MTRAGYLLDVIKVGNNLSIKPNYNPDTRKGWIQLTRKIGDTFHNFPIYDTEDENEIVRAIIEAYAIIRQNKEWK